MAEPVPPKVFKHDKLEWSLWDRWILEGDLTVKDVLNWFEVCRRLLHKIFLPPWFQSIPFKLSTHGLHIVRASSGVLTVLFSHTRDQSTCQTNLKECALEGYECCQNLLKPHWMQERNLDAYSISFGSSLIYSNMFPKHQERLQKKVSSLVTTIGKAKIPEDRKHFDIVVACDDAEGEDVEVPLISIKFRWLPVQLTWRQACVLVMNNKVLVPFSACCPAFCCKAMFSYFCLLNKASATGNELNSSSYFFTGLSTKKRRDCE